MATEELKKRVEEVLDQVRPGLQRDGGDVKLVDVEGDTVKVELQGRCKGCPMSQITLQMGIARTIKAEIPEIKNVEAVNSNIPDGMMEHFQQMYE